MSRLVGMQTNKHNGKSFICLNCFNTFSIEESFKKHTEFCLSNETVRVDMPKKGTSIKFDKFGKTLKVPFVIYADFESFTEKIHSDGIYDCEQSYTRKYQKHTPSGFCYYIVYRGGVYKKPTVYTGENVAEEFCKHIKMETQEIYDKYLKNIVPLKMTQDNVNKYEENNVCHICERTIDVNDVKVKDHNHLTGEFVGAAHQSCNLAFKEPSFIPIVFHNLSGYDAHLFIKQLGISEGDINCIADNEEKYISFTKMLQVDTFTNEEGVEKKVYLNNRFIDSLKFMQSGLDSLVKNLTKNGTDDTLLSHTTNRFQETKKDYHDLYLESDVLLLTDVFENFREVCQKNYELDPAWYLTSPGLSWDAMLKKTDVELDLLTDPDMLMMFEKGTRGGVSMISNRHSKANNKYCT